MWRFQDNFGCFVRFGVVSGRVAGQGSMYWSSAPASIDNILIYMLAIEHMQVLLQYIRFRNFRRSLGVDSALRSAGAKIMLNPPFLKKLPTPDPELSLRLLSINSLYSSGSEFTEREPGPTVPTYGTVSSVSTPCPPNENNGEREMN